MNASVFGSYSCRAVNAIGGLERVVTLRPGLKPDAPTVSLVPQMSEADAERIRRTNNETDDTGTTGPSVVVVESDPDAIYLNLTLPGLTAGQNVTEMDVTGFRVQFVSHANFTLANRTWADAVAVDFPYRTDGSPYVLRNLSWDRVYLVRAATKNVAGFSDFSEPPLQVDLSSSQLGQTSGNGHLLPMQLLAVAGLIRTTTWAAIKYSALVTLF